MFLATCIATEPVRSVLLISNFTIKAKEKVPFVDCTAWFQFHTGSIKSLIERPVDEADERVSIPYWFDYQNSIESYIGEDTPKGLKVPLEVQV